MATEQLAPTSILASTNLTGTVGNIQDDPLSPDGLWLSATDGTADTSVRVAMADPAQPLTVGVNQTVRVLVRKSSTGGNDPSASVTLWENGSGPIKTLVGSTTITSTTGTVLTGTFLRSDLATPSGAGVEIRVIGTASAGNPSLRRTIGVGAVRWVADTSAPTPQITDAGGDEDFRDGETVVITGSNFGATQGAGKVEISDNATYATGTKINQPVTSWGNTSITITAALGTLTPGARWLWVTDNAAGRNQTGFPVTIHRKIAFGLAASANIAAAAATATTPQLTAPAGKNTGQHTAGRISDDTNPLPAIDIAADGYTELEWNVQATADAGPDTTVYEWRVLAGTSPLASYTTTPLWTIGAGVTTVNGTGTAAASGAGSASGVVTVHGSGTGAGSAAGSASGEVTVSGSATGAAAGSGTASGEVTVAGTATGAATATGSASGAGAVNGTATGAATATGSATGQVAVHGIGTAAGSASGSATGEVTTVGTAVGAGSAIGSASGEVTVAGTATGTATGAGSASGQVTRYGTATATATASGTATGQVPGAFPRSVTISGEGAPIVAETSPHTAGPFLSSLGSPRHLYFVAETPASVAPLSQLTVYKSTNRGVDWTRTSSGAGNDLEALSVRRVPGRTGELMVLWQDGGGNSIESRRYGLSDHATIADGFVAATVQVQDQGGNYVHIEQVTMTRLGTDRLFAAFNTPAGSNGDRVDYAVYDTTSDTWDLVGTVDTATAGSVIGCHTPWTCTAADGSAWVIYPKSEAGGIPIYARTFSLAETFGSPIDVSDGKSLAVVSANQGALIGAHVIGSTLYVVWRDSAGIMWMNTVTGGTAGTAIQVSTRTVQTDWPSASGSDGPSACTVVDGSTIYVIFGETTTHDLYLTKSEGGAAFTGETLIGGTIDTMHVFADVLEYSLSDRVIGIIVEDAEGGTPAEGPIWYDEYPLPAIITGTATGTATATGSATGEVTVAGTATGAATGAGSATGQVTVAGTAVAVASGAGTASGQVTTTGTASSAGSASGSATGEVTTVGTCTGAATATGSAAGEVTVAGTATGAASASGTASGSSTGSGTGTAAATASGAATGEVTTVGTAAGVASATGSAVGSSGAQGTATGAATSAGAATGEVTVHADTAVGAATATGSATGTTTGSGTATAAATATGSAIGQSAGSGTAVAAATASGAATGEVTAAGAATGAATSAGSASGISTGSGTGTGAASSSATAAGTVTRTGTCTATATAGATCAGHPVVHATATAAASATGAATGPRRYARPMIGFEPSRSHGHREPATVHAHREP